MQDKAAVCCRAERCAAGLRCALAASVALVALSCSRGPTVTLHGTRAEVQVQVEVASDPATRAAGLMYRRELAAGAGMLFVFPAAAVQKFWMKNTFISLDMIFIDASGHVVGVVANARPLSTIPVAVGVPSRYVLEVNAGFAARNGIEKGTRVDFAGVPDDGR